MAPITNVEARMQAALVRIRRRLERKFPIGSRVRLKAEWRRTWPKYAETTGTVVRYQNGVSLMVRFDGRKTASGWHPDLFKKVRP
jgi:hypothetical protein